ncbi:hypothetical protein [Paenibacillus sp. IHB B 3415]|uniref:hypothetical protein n=1 Tax=Paenibacillus sp. IHB B 3415 TaxID=867080 RepID=UPI000A6EF2EC|nr:hypothetical protein [Paenibacillus sp. IHB B 3415]
MNFERRAYEKWTAYGQSKTANVLFALELDKRGQAHGVRAFSVHPGSILTDLAGICLMTSCAACEAMTGVTFPA